MRFIKRDEVLEYVKAKQEVGKIEDAKTLVKTREYSDFQKLY